VVAWDEGGAGFGCDLRAEPGCDGIHYHCGTKTMLGQTDPHGGSQAALPPTDRVSAPAPMEDNSSTSEGLTLSVETWLPPCLQDAKMERHLVYRTWGELPGCPGEL
jgi:hypothetical protein